MKTVSFLGFCFGIFFGYFIALFSSVNTRDNVYQYCAMREVKSGDCVALVDRKHKKEVSLYTSSDYLIIVPTIGEPE